MGDTQNRVFGWRTYHIFRYSDYGIMTIENLVLLSSKIVAIIVTNTCEKIVRGKSDASFRLGRRLFRDLLFQKFNSKLVEHRDQSPVRVYKMLAVWPYVTEGFPTARS